MPSLQRDRENLAQFSKAMDRAYAKAKRDALIPEDDIRQYDKLLATGPVYSGEMGGWAGGRPIQTHRIWRRRIARLYYRKTQGRLFGAGFDFDINWDDIMTWIMENIVPIMKMLLAILPFLI